MSEWAGWACFSNRGIQLDTANPHFLLHVDFRAKTQLRSNKKWHLELKLSKLGYLGENLLRFY